MFQSLLLISAASLKHSFYICQRKRFLLPSLKYNFSSETKPCSPCSEISWARKYCRINIFSMDISFNKSTTIFHGLHSSRPLKWRRKMFKTVKFWTFCGIISMVYKSVDHGKVWSICFLQEHLFFLRKNKKNKTADTAWHVTSFPWSILSYTIALDQSAREDSLSYCKMYYRS